MLGVIRGLGLRNVPPPEAGDLVYVDDTRSPSPAGRQIISTAANARRVPLVTHSIEPEPARHRRSTNLLVSPGSGDKTPYPVMAVAAVD